MAHLIKSSTDKNDKNRWGTSLDAFNDAKTVTGYSFILDACAEEATKKCEQFISPVDLNLLGEADHSLFTNWKQRFQKSLTSLAKLPVTAPSVIPSAIWCNPPFDDKQAFIQTAYECALNYKIPVVMMLPYERQTIWWQCMIHNIAAKVFIPDRRYNYLETDGITKKKGVNFGSCFVLFDSSVFNETAYIDFNLDLVRQKKHLQPENLLENAKQEDSRRRSKKWMKAS